MVSGITEEIIEYLRKVGRLSPDHTEWVMKFSDGSEVVINDLFEGFLNDHMGQRSDRLGRYIDSVENMQYALDIPMPAQFHVDRFKESLPDLVKGLKTGYVELTGDDPLA